MQAFGIMLKNFSLCLQNFILADLTMCTSILLAWYRERDMSTEKNAISFEAQGCSNEKTVADNIMFTVLLPASPRPVPDEVEPHSPKDLFQEEELEKAEDLRKRKRIKRERNLSLRGRKCQIVIGGTLRADDKAADDVVPCGTDLIEEDVGDPQTNVANLHKDVADPQKDVKTL
ncbi:hypothetical protein KC19_VG240600 [Ceratodon purpureus]|uniref:Uncharacterized protein n=1 Tax=Ceratodon purpureus TaxID=3225 RepID=A0A8T0HUG4_CERPU|nr:hypothetical protein KC19_VG240600 [Ceratodon purpureus]